MLIFSGILGGYSAAIKLIKKVNFLEGYIEFINICENEIRFTGNPLSEIIKNYSREGIFSSYLIKCYEYISLGQSFPSSWNKAFSDIDKTLSVPKEVKEIIINFGLGLGANDINGQISHCKYNYELILPYLKSSIEERKSKGKLYIILGTCIGAMIALFLI